jgi:hypothetical protein
MQEAPWVEGLRQFSDVDDARFFLLADAKMDAISRVDAIDQGWIGHAEGHFHWSHEIARRSDGLMIQQDKPLIYHNAEHRPFAFVRTPFSRLESGESENRPQHAGQHNYPRRRAVSWHNRVSPLLPTIAYHMMARLLRLKRM